MFIVPNATTLLEKRSLLYKPTTKILNNLIDTVKCAKWRINKNYHKRKVHENKTLNIWKKEAKQTLLFKWLNSIWQILICHKYDFILHFCLPLWTKSQPGLPLAAPCQLPWLTLGRHYLASQWTHLFTELIHRQPGDPRWRGRNGFSPGAVGSYAFPPLCTIIQTLH